MAAKKKSKKAKKAAARKAASKSKARPAKKARAAASSSGLALASVSPAMTVNDIHRSLAWYRDVLGFVAGERWEKDGALLGVEMKAGKVAFWLGQDDWQKGRDRRKGEGFRIYCTTTQNVDAIAAGIKARGGKLDSEPADMPWGFRLFRLRDPDGYRFAVASPLPA